MFDATSGARGRVWRLTTDLGSEVRVSKSERVGSVALVTCLALTIPAPAMCQAPSPVALRSPAHHVMVPSLAVPRQADREPNVWRWVLVGAVSGAVVGGVVAGLELSRTNDVFFPQLMVGAGITVGALGGALLGAIAFAVTHDAVPRSRDQSP